MVETMAASSVAMRLEPKREVANAAAQVATTGSPCAPVRILPYADAEALRAPWGAGEQAERVAHGGVGTIETGRWG
jgi:hypothetical protein